MAMVFLQLDEVLDIHQDQIQRYGGSPGVRDIGLLQSALAMPASSFGGEYLHKDIFEMAAAYLFHIVQGHPFIDGNKRTGAMAAFVFLRMNGVTMTANENIFETLVRDVAQGKSEKPAITKFLRQHTPLKIVERPLPSSLSVKGDLKDKPV